LPLPRRRTPSRAPPPSCGCPRMPKHPTTPLQGLARHGSPARVLGV
jgi:hypothetical protein